MNMLSVLDSSRIWLYHKKLMQNMVTFKTLTGKWGDEERVVEKSQSNVSRNSSQSAQYTWENTLRNTQAKIFLGNLDTTFLNNKKIAKSIKPCITEKGVNSSKISLTDYATIISKDSEMAD